MLVPETKGRTSEEFESVDRFSRLFHKNRRNNLFLTMVPTAVRMTSWRYEVLAYIILTAVLIAVGILTMLVLTTVLNCRRENVSHGN